MLFHLKIIDFGLLIEYADTMKKAIWLYPVVFISTVLVCLVFLMGTAMIPQEALRENVSVSAQYFSDVPLFENSVGELVNFRKDNYADCITTGIAWHLGEGNVYEAVITAEYAREPHENVNVSFRREMSGEEVSLENYSRYWHGSAGVVRMLLLFTDVQNVRYIIATLGLVFNIMLVVTLMRKGHKALGISYGIAFLLVNGVFALTCLEYSFVLGIVPLATLFLLREKIVRQADKAVLSFMVIGMLTAFFDFLTAETLTFTVPFIMYYLVVRKSSDSAVTVPVKIKRKRGSSADSKEKMHIDRDWCLLLKSGISWCAGYAVMFLTKWGLATLVLGKEAFLTSVDSAMERIGGEVSTTLNMADEQADLGQRIQGIFQRNLGCLYWGNQEMKAQTVIMITVIVVTALAVFWYMTRKEKYRYDKVWIPAVVALIPYVRFLVVSNHTYIHYFFTYRAQLVTVMIVLYLIYDSTFLSGKKGKKKKWEGEL